MRPPVLRLYQESDLDAFAGGGGASTGMAMALGVSPAIAINHDPIALAMHEANHPETQHILSDIRAVRYEQIVPASVRLRVAWFSPDCTYHSKARGGKPFRDPQWARRIRGLAWEAIRCANALHAATPAGERSRAPRLIVLENVEEWQDWCPLLPDGRPDWSRRGANYRRWTREMAKAGPGYVIEKRELVACDYGDPTKRKRLFVVCRSDGQPIAWPEPTHGPGRAHAYRTAAECIDFSLPVPSIFMTKPQAYAWAKRHGLSKAAAPRRPLATSTKRRIAHGVVRYVLNDPAPFIINTRHTGHGDRDLRMQPVTAPIATVPASGREHALVQPKLAPFSAAFLAKRTAVTARATMLPDPPAGGTYAEVRVTLVAKDALDQAFADTAVKICAFLVKYFGTGVARRLDQPLGTVTTTDRLGLVEVILIRIGDDEWVLADIGMRMLTPRELFLCQGFPATYEIDTVRVRTPLGEVVPTKLTKKTQVKLVGNSVPPNVAAAIIAANLPPIPAFEAVT